MRFWRQNVASRIYALLSVIRQQMFAFYPFRGGRGRPKRTISVFFYTFFRRASLTVHFSGRTIRPWTIGPLGPTVPRTFPAPLTRSGWTTSQLHFAGQFLTNLEMISEGLEIFFASSNAWLGTMQGDQTIIVFCFYDLQSSLSSSRGGG